MKIQRSLAILVFAAVAVWAFPGVRAADEAVVATLGSNSFLAKDFRLSADRVPGAVSNSDATADAVTTEKAKRLSDWVLNASMRESARELGITVSADEQQAALKDTYGDEDQAIANLTNAMAKLSLALRKALSSPEREHEIYEEYLAEVMSHDTWLGHLARYNSEEKIESLEKMARPSKSDLYKPMPSLEKILLEKKLRETVVASATVPESRIREEYARRYPSQRQPYEEVSGAIQSELLQAEKQRVWESWRVNTLKSAKVVIRDERLKQAYLKLLEGLPKQAE